MKISKTAIILLLLTLSPAGTARARVPPYSVSIHLRGEEPRELRQLLWNASTVAVHRDSPPPSFLLLEAIARDDIRKMRRILRAESFYNSDIAFEIKDRDRSPRLYFSVNTGPPFAIREVKIENIGPPLPPELIRPGGEEILLPPGSRATSTAILNAENALVNFFRRRGYPDAQAAERKVVVDHADQTVTVAFQVDPGFRSAFADTIIIGLEDVRESFVRRMIPWEKGQVYNPLLVQTFRNRLARSGLFTMLLVSAEEAAPLPEPAEEVAYPLRPLNILVNLRERAPHTVGLEAGYSTDIGFGGAVSWEDRNLFGGGELFRIRLFASEELYYAEGLFRLPTFLHPDQSLNLTLQPVYDAPRAYSSYRLRGSTVLRREFSDALVASAGVALTSHQVKQFNRDQDYLMLSAPLSVQLRLGGEQPFRRAGALLLLQAEPYYDLNNELTFVKTVASGNFLYRVPGLPFLTALARVTAGSISDARLGQIPADLRFYAGGANSIRGYAHQMAGPLVGNKPVGGLSLFTANFELNCRVLGDFGVAAFLDGGASFAERVPERGDEFRWGTGGGLRYFTPIGPIGLDIGFPIEPRRGIDSDFHVYVSIAQIY